MIYYLTLTTHYSLLSFPADFRRFVSRRFTQIYSADFRRFFFLGSCHHSLLISHHSLLTAPYSLLVSTCEALNHEVRIHDSNREEFSTRESKANVSTSSTSAAIQLFISRSRKLNKNLFRYNEWLHKKNIKFALCCYN